MKARIALSLVLLALAVPAWADVASGRAMIEQGSYEQAFYELLPLAEAQDAAAQYLVGGLYLIGRGVPQDPDEARKWLMRSAHNGHAEAAMALGDIAARGFGGKPDPAQALVWYRRAAEQGVAPAQNNLGIAMASGKGTSRDLKGATQWLERAAKQGNVEAQYNLGHILGTGGPQMKPDPERALLWYAIAAKSGLKEAEKPRDALIRQLGKKSKLTLASAQRFVAKPEPGLPSSMPKPTAQPEPALPPAPAKPEPAAASKNDDKTYPPLPQSRKAVRGYKIQLASGASQADVSKQASKLRFDMPDLLGDLEVSIVYGEAGFTALMGPFVSPDAAEALCDKLKGRGVKSCSAVPP
jgi:cell division septation protein DedD